jgi:MerR family copper efflux transcriptional regulator
LRTGEVVSHSGVDRETLRFYENKGLITKPAKDNSGYRNYPEGILERLDFIGKAKEAGFSLKEVSRLLDLKENGAPCKHGKSIALEKLDDIEKKIESLKAMKKIMEQFVETCDSSKKEMCHLSFQELN